MRFPISFLTWLIFIVLVVLFLCWHSWSFRQRLARCRNIRASGVIVPDSVADFRRPLSAHTLSNGDAPPSRARFPPQQRCCVLSQREHRGPAVDIAVDISEQFRVQQYEGSK